MSEKDKRVMWEFCNGIGIITLNSPPANYLYEPEFISQENFRQWTSDPGLKGIIIHGKGKHFSAGGDLERLFDIVEEDAGLEKKMTSGNALLSCISKLDVPLLAAIQGVCFGGGLEVALACHIRIAGEKALFAFPEVNRNLMPGMGGTVRLPGVIGNSNALKMIISGEMISADEAMKMNLIDTIVPGEEVLDYSIRLLSKMVTDKPIDVIHAVVRSIRNATELPPDKAIAEETRLFCRLAYEEAERRRINPEE